MKRGQCKRVVFLIEMLKVKRKKSSVEKKCYEHRERLKYLPILSNYITIL